MWLVCGEAKGLYNPSYSDVETVHDGEEFFSASPLTIYILTFLTSV
jgi:hypothetical protein